MCYSKWVCILAALIYVCKSSHADLSYNRTIYPEEINPVENYYNNSSAELEYGRSQHDRKSKFLFSVIQRFTTEICRTTNEKRGLCQTKSQCAAGGGTAQGSCAQGIAVCCRYVVHCGGVVTKNGTSFQNPEYPSKYTPSDGSSNCQLRIRRQFNVCQLRLNFEMFQINGPTEKLQTATGTTTPMFNDAGTCKNDSLSITASGGSVSNLCGNLTSQHIYVEYGSSDTITLNLLLSSTTSEKDRQWDIEIYMIPCNSPSRAPPGCLQWYTGMSGKVMSFNFKGQHLANMEYSACIRPEDGMKFIDWTPCNPGDVNISGIAMATPTVKPLLCPTDTKSQGANDYLIITGGISYPLDQTSTMGKSLSDRFCDFTWQNSSESAYVRSSSRPFLLQFKSDGREAAPVAVGMDQTEGYKGYCLKWQQNSQ